MARIVKALAAMLLGLLGTSGAVLAATTAVGSAGSIQVAQAYTYDGHRSPVPLTDTTTERGPPAYTDTTIHDAVDLSSPGGFGVPAWTFTLRHHRP